MHGGVGVAVVQVEGDEVREASAEVVFEAQPGVAGGELEGQVVELRLGQAEDLMVLEDVMHAAV